jgi:hypothetical protein
LIVAACSASDASSDLESAPPPNMPSAGSTAGTSAGAQVIDIAADSHLSIAMRGGGGPIVEGQTVTRAMITISDVELVSDSGETQVLRQDAVSLDLLALENRLQTLVQQQSIAAGRFTSCRFRLSSAWIETEDTQGGVRVFASDGVDPSQFASAGVSRASRLDLAGFDSDGFVEVALPQDGIAVSGDAQLAFHFDLAESLTFRRDSCVLSPNVWIVDQSIFSSIDVQLEATTEITQLVDEGFQVELFDAGFNPICTLPLTQVSATVLVASFQLIESFGGPFVAVLVPPSGFALSASIAVSVDVQAGVAVQTAIDVSSISVVSRTSSLTTLDVRTSRRARVVARDRKGVIVNQSDRDIGSLDQVAPRHPPKWPERAGHEHKQNPTPSLSGMPAPLGNPGPKPPPPRPRTHDGGAPPPPPPPRDAGGPPPHRDSGIPPIPPPHFDAGSPIHPRPAGYRER